MNKILSALSVICLVFVLSAWSPVETSNTSITRLSLDGRDFCSGVFVERLNDKYTYMATAAHCAEAASGFIERKVYYPDGHFTVKATKIFYDLRIKQNRVADNGVVYLINDMHGQFVRYDVINDVAIYLVYTPKDMGIEPVKLAVTEVHYGDKVYSMGMPLSIWGTINLGYVTKPRIGATQGLPAYIPQDAILHTAFMAPGISGGGLFNDRGELIGLTNWGIPGGPYLATRVIHVADLLAEIDGE